jgi:glutamine synthetase
VGSSATSAWPNTVMNTIVAESIDALSNELEKELGGEKSPARLESAVRAVLQRTIKAHKRVIFNGDGYSAEWHREAERRGLPHLRNSVDALPVLGTEKAAALFEKYSVLSRSELDSRVHAYLEKYCKQIQIESEAMVLIARQQILPATLQHQTRLAQAVASTKAAGVECRDQAANLQAFVELVHRLTATTAALAEADNARDDDPLVLARHLRDKVVPVMQSLREIADELETQVSADLWPLPSYRELLFIK